MRGFRTKRISAPQEKLLRMFFERDNREEFLRLSHLGSNGNGGHAQRTARSLVDLGLFETVKKNAGRMSADGGRTWRTILEPAYRISDEGVALIETLGKVKAKR